MVAVAYTLGPFDQIVGYSKPGGYAALVTLPDPTPYRSLFLNSVTVSDLPALVTVSLDPDGDFGNTTTLIQFSSGSTVYGSIAGTRIFGDIIPFPIVPGSVQHITFSNWSNGGSVLNGVTIRSFGEFGGVDDSSGVTITPIASTGAYIGALSAWTADNNAFRAAQGGDRLQVTMSNGEILATVPQVKVEDHYEYEPQLSAAIAAQAAGNAVAIAGYNASHTLSMAVDAGTFAEASGGLAQVTSYWTIIDLDTGPGHPVPPNTTSTGSTVVLGVLTPGGLFPTWLSQTWDGTSVAQTTSGPVTFTVPTDTNSAGKIAPEAIAREKARRKTNSETAVQLLSSGVLTDGRVWWSVLVKVGAAGSGLPRAVSPFTVTLNGDAFPVMLYSLGFLTGLGFLTTPTYDVWLATYVPGGPSTNFDATVSRSITARYTDAQGVLHEETITGTWRQQRTVYPYGSGNFFHSYTNTFTNYPAFDVVTGLCPLDTGQVVTLGARSPTTGPARDGSTALGIVLNGTMVYGHAPDSAYREPSNAAGVGAGVVPPIVSTILISTLPLYLQYLRDVKPVDVNVLPDPKPAYSPHWLSTSMVDDEVVTLTPFAPVKDDELLGMFGDKTGAQKIKVYGKAKFRYNLDGSFTFVSWTEVGAIVPLQWAGNPLTWPAANCTINYQIKSDKAPAVTGVTGAAGDTLNRENHGLLNGMSVSLESLTGGQGLAVGSYFVVGATAHTFKFAAAAGGAPLVFTTAVTAASVARIVSWSDVKAAATAQRSAISNPVTNTDKFLALIKQVAP